MRKKTKTDLARTRYEATLEKIAVWEKRERRAMTALAKLRDAKLRYERRRPDLIRSVLIKHQTMLARPGRGHGNGHDNALPA